MTNRIAPHALLAALLLAPASLLAQPAPATLPDAGARVRVVLVDRGRVVGTLVAREPDRWLVRRERGDTVLVAAFRIEQVDVSLGRRSPEEAFWYGARTGFLVGGGITVAGGALLLAQDGGGCHDCIFPPVLVVGMLGGALTLGTTLLGGIFGSQQLDRWERVTLPAEARVGVVSTPHGPGVGLRLALPR